MNNKPVAWMSVELNGKTVLATYEFETAIPLYTHPVKELTDEEIRAEWYNNCGKDDWFMDFARAILRKVQEK